MRCQISVHSREHGRGRYRPLEVDDDRVTTDLTVKGIDLVAPAQAKGGPPHQEERHVGAQPAGQEVESGPTQTHSPEPVQGHQHRRGVAAPPRQPPADGDAFGDGDLRPPLDARVALQLESGPQGQVPFVAGHGRIVAAHHQPARTRLDQDVVVKIDRLEERAQLVVAVRAHTEDLQPEVDLGVGADAQRPRLRGRLQRPLRRLRASSASTER